MRARHAGRLCRQFEHPVEFLLGAFVLPGLVIEILAPTGGIGADHLDVSVCDRTDPHFLPRRRNDEVLDSLQRDLVGQHLAVGAVVAETLPLRIRAIPGLLSTLRRNRMPRLQLRCTPCGAGITRACAMSHLGE